MQLGIKVLESASGQGKRKATAQGCRTARGGCSSPPQTPGARRASPGGRARRQGLPRAAQSLEKLGDRRLQLGHPRLQLSSVLLGLQAVQQYTRPSARQRSGANGCCRQLAQTAVGCLPAGRWMCIQPEARALPHLLQQPLVPLRHVAPQLVDSKHARHRHSRRKGRDAGTQEGRHGVLARCTETLHAGHLPPCAGGVPSTGLWWWCCRVRWCTDRLLVYR